MARTQQGQSSSNWHQAGYHAGIGLKNLRRSLKGAEQRLVLRAGENARWMRLGLLVLKVLAAVALVATALAAFWVLIWIVLPAVVVIGALMLGGGASQQQDSGLGGEAGYTGYGDLGDGEGYYVDGYRIE
ncbi:hypothetical protein ACYCFK_09260 [Stutzerimonas stutzeri]